MPDGGLSLMTDCVCVCVYAKTNGANAPYNIAGVSIVTDTPQTEEKSVFTQKKMNLIISF